MNRYKKLAINSIIFAIGNFGSKLISLLLVPLYTYYLSTEQYGNVDLVTTTLSLLLPIFALSIYDAVLRFVMDNNYEKPVVLNNALVITIFGCLFACLMFPIFKTIFPFRDYIIYFYIMLFTSSLNTTIMQFIRANNQVKLFALIGILSSFVVLLGNVLFLVVFHLGVPGYLMSLISADLLSISILISFGHVFKYISISHLNWRILKEMLVYSIPLIPNALMWWVMGVSDRYLVTYFIGVSANGLYAVANKIPSILNVINSIFFQAWQMSAIEEANSQSKSQFYSKVFNVLSAVMFISTSFLLIFLKLVMRSVISADFFQAWEFVPFLLLGVIFSSFSSFLGTNYIASKNTVGVFRTSIIGAVINIAANLILIPHIGTNGASISTMFSFFIIWILRAIETKSFVRISYNIYSFIGNLLIILLQILIIYLAMPMNTVWQIILFTIIVLLNINQIKILFEKIYCVAISKIKK